MTDRPPFDSLDFLYIPSRDVASDASYFARTLGGRVVFAIEAWNTRVAMVEMTPGPPHLLFTDHVEGDVPILIYRVADLSSTLDRLEASGWARETVFEIPQGPCSSFRSPGGHRLAIYQMTRPEVVESFEGRADF
jgi:hypothetical protein